MSEAAAPAWRLDGGVLRGEWLVALVVGLTVLVTLLAWPSLPEQVPTHFGVDGQADAFGPAWTVWLIPVLQVAVVAGMLLLPYLDPKRRNYADFWPAYRMIRLLLVGFFLLLQLVILGTALGIPVEVNRVMGVGVGLLTMGLGNVLGQVRQTWFVGIRTPWTLSDPEVWRRTHRWSARVWVGAGLIGTVASLVVPVQLVIWFAIGPLLLAAVASVVYSWVAWRRLHPEA